jgi:hypothetical protein
VVQKLLHTLSEGSFKKGLTFSLHTRFPNRAADCVNDCLDAMKSFNGSRSESPNKHSKLSKPQKIAQSNRELHLSTLTDLKLHEGVKN